MDSSSGGRRFRIIDLMAIVAAIGVLLGITVLLTRRSMESVHRTACVSNLRSIQYHHAFFYDVRRKGVPLSSGPGEVSGLYYLSYDSQYIHNLVYSRWNGGAPVHFEDVWATWPGNIKNKLGSHMRCPTRRATPGSQSKLQGSGAGPLSDYAFIVLSPKDDWFDFYDPCNSAVKSSIESLVLPSDVPNCSNPDYEKAKRFPTYDLQMRAKDGYDNIIYLGEKHVRFGEIGRCCGTSLTEGSDGTYLFADNKSRMYGVGRNISFPLSTGGRDFRETNDGPDREFGFGSWHPGITHFVFVGGAIRAFNNDVDPAVLEKLARVDDGELILLQKWFDDTGEESDDKKGSTKGRQ